MKRASLLLILVFMTVAAQSVLTAEEIVINAVGDVMLAGRWASVIKEKGYDTVFSHTASELAKGDINMANLESPLARAGTEFTTKKFRFRADPEVATAIRKAGFHLVNLANNHSMDFGGEALAETMRNLEQAGVSWVGAGENLGKARQMVAYTIKGVKVAFLGYSLTQPVEFFAGKNRPGTAPGWENYYSQDIAAAKKHADYVIVSFHWGKEGSSAVQPYQRTAAHKAIDAGAVAVIGHHPHILQGVERYRHGIILYSLGNFAFASSSRTAASAAMARLRLNGTRCEAEILPLDVLNRRVNFQPRLLSGKQADSVIKRLNEISKPLGTEIKIHGDKYYVAF